jgi:hypothetical protein
MASSLDRHPAAQTTAVVIVRTSSFLAPRAQHANASQKPIHSSMQAVSAFMHLGFVEASMSLRYTARQSRGGKVPEKIRNQKDMR